MNKCVEIEALPDGSFTVSECEPKAEAGEGEGGQPSQGGVGTAAGVVIVHNINQDVAHFAQGK
jgi:hypothetical protein